MSCEQADSDQELKDGWTIVEIKDDTAINYDDDDVAGGMGDCIDYEYEESASNQEYLEETNGGQMEEYIGVDFSDTELNYSFDATAEIETNSGDVFEENYAQEAEEIEEDDRRTLFETNASPVPEHNLSSTDGDVDRYYCCECNSLFEDYESADQHDCPGLNANEAQESPVVDSVVGDEELCLKPFVCESCELAFETDERLQKHLRNCSSKPETDCKEPTMFSYYRCGECDRSFTSEQGLRLHTRSHRAPYKPRPAVVKPPQEPAICTICNTTFRSQKNLKLHIKIHDKRPAKSIQEALPDCAKEEYNELNQFFCEICNKRFEQNLLTVHQQMHTQAEEYVCSICNRQFENLPSYEVHQQLHAELKRPTSSPYKQQGVTKRIAGTKMTFPCQYCGREFPRPHEKVKHERVHTGEKPYSCEVCGKTFRVSYSLTLHLRTHTDIRPFVCATCNKRFKSQPVYVHHMKTHLAERSYTCNICMKSFRTSVQLCGHRKSHSKPYNCPDCNRPFAAMYALKLHMKTHNKTHKSSESLRHQCTICGAVYARHFALQLHMKEQHGIAVPLNKAGKGDVSEVDHDDENIESIDVGEDDDDDEDLLSEDNEAAVLIAAAAGANYADAEATNQLANEGILQNEEIIVEDYNTEEIVVDWLSK